MAVNFFQVRASRLARLVGGTGNRRDLKTASRQKKAKMPKRMSMNANPTFGNADGNTPNGGDTLPSKFKCQVKFCGA